MHLHVCCCSVYFIVVALLPFPINVSHDCFSFLSTICALHPTTHNGSQPYPVYTSKPISQPRVTRGHAFPTVDWICYHRVISLLCGYVQSSATTTCIGKTRIGKDQHIITDTNTHKLQEGKGYGAVMYHPRWHGLFTQVVVGLLTPTLLSCAVAIFLHWMTWM